MIQHLQVVGDELIKQFKKNELQPVIDNNIYHSPEESETDSEDGKKIVVNDLRWRSSTVSNLFLFLCYCYFNLY